MKKELIITIALILCAIISFLSAYNTFKQEKKEIANINKEYEMFYNVEIYGSELATIINKIVDNNTKFNIEKDEKGNYIEDEQNSIKMDVYIIDSETSYSIERIYSLGTERFVTNFDLEKFKCTKIEYHSRNKKVKYLYFEQVAS